MEEDNCPGPGHGWHTARGGQGWDSLYKLVAHEHERNDSHKGLQVMLDLGDHSRSFRPQVCWVACAEGRMHKGGL